MKFILMSDLHLVAKNPQARKDDLVEIQFEKLKFILNYAKENEAPILQAGDFFNVPRSWALLPRVIDLLKKYKVDIYCVFGQHDTYFYNEETRERTNLGILEKTGLVHILDEEDMCFEDRVCVYGASFGKELPDILIASSEEINIGVIHAPIAERAIYPGQNYIDAKTYLKNNQFYDLILCGDIHRSFYLQDENKRRIVNTGPVLRKEASEYNMKFTPNFIVYDSSKKSIQKILIPCKDSELVLDRTHIEKEDSFEDMMDSFVNEMNTETVVSGASFPENLASFIRTNPINENVRKIISEKMEKKG